MDTCHFVCLAMLFVECCYGRIILGGYDRDLSAQVDELRNTVLDLKMQLDNLKKDTPASDTVKRDARLADFSRDNGVTLRANPGTETAFYTVLSEDVRLSRNQKLVFDIAMTNQGSAYDPSTGLFIAPANGLYVFSLNIACAYGNYVEISVMLNGDRQTLLNTICKNTTPNEVHQNGGSAVASLNKGDKLHVQMIWPSGRSGSVIGQGLSSFSGFILRTLS